MLRKCGNLISLSRRGNCYDNSIVLRRENSPLDCFLILFTFFKTIKSELIWLVAFAHFVDTGQSHAGRSPIDF